MVRTERSAPKANERTSPIIVAHICYIFNKALETGVLSEDWNNVNVSPIFNGNLPTNNCIVSLTCGLVKVLERLVKKGIVSNLDNGGDLVTS